MQGSHTCSGVCDIGVLDLPNPRFGWVDVPNGCFLGCELCFCVEEANVIRVFRASRHGLCVNLHSLTCSVCFSPLFFDQEAGLAVASEIQKMQMSSDCLTIRFALPFSC